MIDNNNIEDLFKNTFENDRVEPSTQSWNKINKKLFVQNATNVFKGFKVNPSTQVWSSISKKLFWLSFLRFNVRTFNAYYVGAFALLSVLIYTGINYTDSNNALLSENSEIYNEQNTNSLNNNGTNTTENSLIENNNLVANTENTKSNIIDNNSISNNSNNAVLENNNFTKNNSNIAKNNNETNNDIAVNNSKDNTTKITSTNNNDYIAENNTVLESNISNTSTIADKNIVSNSENNNDDITVINNTSNNDNSTLINASTNNIAESSEVLSNNYTKINTTKPDDIILNNTVTENTSNTFNSPEYLATKISKIKIQDTDSLEQIINPDTVAIDAFNEPIVIHKSNLYFDIVTSGAKNTFSFSNFNNDTKYGKIINDATTGEYSYSAGARIGYRHKSWLAETGISFAKFNEKFDYNYLSDKIDTSYYYDVYDASYIKHDTVMFLDLDALLATGDTVYSPFVYQTWVDAKDSTLNTQLDSSKVQEKLNTRNIYTYVEIPLIIGYQIQKHKFTYSLNSGLITGIYIKSKGSTISQNNYNDVVDITKANLPNMKFNYSFVISGGIAYKINDKLHILAEPFYRQSINSLFDKNYLYSKKNKVYGATVGLRYIIK